MRFSDNHDEKRAIARFGEPSALAASALVFTMTMDGVPMLHNGMEVGDRTESGAPALFEKLRSRSCRSSGRSPSDGGHFLPFYKQLIATRRAHPALQQGETEWVGNAAPDHVLTFFRHGDGEEYFVAINVSNQPCAGVADAPAGEYMDETPGFDHAAGRRFRSRRLSGRPGTRGLPQSPSVMTSRRSPLLRARELFMVFA